jgi:hypothetical protein
MLKIMEVIFGKDPLKKRLKRGAIGAGIFLLLSALGGGLSGGDMFFAIVFVGGFAATIVGALTPMNTLRLIGAGLMLAGATIILGLTVQPMDKGQGFWFFGLGLATWWSAITNFLSKKKKTENQ